MSRHALILYQTKDYHGDLWDVREERPTPYGWPVLMGWPWGAGRGRAGSGGPRVILTAQLRAYLEDLRYDPGLIVLPVGRSALRRLRRELGHNYYRDRPLWWRDREDDLLTMTLEKFCEKHGCSTGAASQARKRFDEEKANV
jgi:hypothetical protein